MDIQKKAYTIIAILILIYASLTLGLPQDPQVLEKYSISVTQAQLLSLSIVLPYVLIWIAGVYAFTALLRYATLIKKAKDGQAFRSISIGLGILVFRFPVASIATTVMAYFTQSNPNLIAVSTITSNYISVIAGVAGFVFVGNGAAILLDLSPKKPPHRGRLVYTLLALVISAGYTYLAIGQPGYQTPVNAESTAAYYLPNWIIISTIVLPYVYAWHRGFAAIYDISFYRRTVPGMLYRRSLKILTLGISAVVTASIMLQFLAAQATKVSGLKLGSLMLIVYLLLSATAFGFILVAIGAKKLKRIEEV